MKSFLRVLLALCLLGIGTAALLGLGVCLATRQLLPAAGCLLLLALALTCFGWLAEKWLYS